MKKEKYDLEHVLYFIFGPQKHSAEDLADIVSEILTQTGLSFDEFNALACQNQTVGQLKYRILGLMDKKKIDSSHIM